MFIVAFLYLEINYWFKTVVPQFKKIWDTILRERKTGYSHRLPKKKQKKTTT